MTPRTRQALVTLAVLAVVVGGKWVLRDEVPGAAPAPVGSVETGPEDLAVPVGPDVFTGRVLHVSDGDTLLVEVLTTARDMPPLDDGNLARIRLLRIDTPEEPRDGEPGECWADEATAALEALTPEDSIVTFQYDVEPLDRFDRHLAHAWTADGRWVNGELLAVGAARAVTFRPNVAHDERVFDLEADARAAGRGLWGAC